ncbi:hypothetical protein Tco_1296239 [Tanacetum coccineum]
MAAGQRKPEVQWTPDERKVVNLDQRLKSLIMYVLLDDQMNSITNCLTAKSTWDDLILYHEGPSDVKESRVMDLKLCYNTFKFKEGESLTQTFTRYKALMNENINHVKDSELASLFGKLKYEENLIDSIYETEKKRSLVSTTPLSTAFFSTSIVQDFQDSHDDEEDTRSSHEYLNDLKEEYQARALLAKSKRFFKKDTQRFSSVKAIDQTECYKCSRKGHFVRDGSSKTSDVEEVSSDDNEVTEVKALMALTTKERVFVSKESASNGEWVKISIQKHVNTEILKENQNLRNELKELTSIAETWLNSSYKVNQPKDLIFVKSSADNSNMSITSSNKPRLYKAEDYTLPNHDTCKVPSDESQRNTADPLVAVSNSSVTDYDSADESSVCSNPLPPLEKLAAHAGKLKNVKMKDDPPLAIVMKELNELKLKISKNKSSYSRNKNSQQLCGSYDHETHGHNKIITLRRVIKPRNPQHVTKNYETCRSNVHTITDHNDIKWFRKREALQAKKAEIFKTSKTKSSSALRSKTPTKRWDSKQN